MMSYYGRLVQLDIDCNLFLSESFSWSIFTETLQQTILNMCICTCVYVYVCSFTYIYAHINIAMYPQA